MLLGQFLSWLDSHALVDSSEAQRLGEMSLGKSLDVDLSRPDEGAVFESVLGKTTLVPNMDVHA